MPDGPPKPEPPMLPPGPDESVAALMAGLETRMYLALAKQPDIRVINADSVDMDASEFAGAVAAEMREVFDYPIVREVERDADGRPIRVVERRVKP
jgi:hypothetical protein